jgi:hypothetical protein
MKPKIGGSLAWMGNVGGIWNFLFCHGTGEVVVTVPEKEGTRTTRGTVCVYPLADARAITLSPPVRTKLSCIASRMATQRDVEYNQIFLNACVLLDCL